MSFFLPLVNFVLLLRLFPSAIKFSKESKGRESERRHVWGSELPWQHLDWEEFHLWQRIRLFKEGPQEISFQNKYATRMTGVCGCPHYSFTSFQGLPGCYIHDPREYVEQWFPLLFFDLKNRVQYFILHYSRIPPTPTSRYWKDVSLNKRNKNIKKNTNYYKCSNYQNTKISFITEFSIWFSDSIHESNNIIRKD